MLKFQSRCNSDASPMLVRIKSELYLCAIFVKCMVDI